MDDGMMGKKGRRRIVCTVPGCPRFTGNCGPPDEIAFNRLSPFSSFFSPDGVNAVSL